MAFADEDKLIDVCGKVKTAVCKMDVGGCVEVADLKTLRYWAHLGKSITMELGAFNQHKVVKTNYDILTHTDALRKLIGQLRWKSPAVMATIYQDIYRELTHISVCGSRLARCRFKGAV